MKKRIIAITMAVVLVLSFTACGLAKKSEESSDVTDGITAPDEEVVIRVGYFNSAQYQTQLAIAEEKGFFDEAFEGYNVKIEYYPFAGAGPAINEAFLAGELDVAHGIGDQPAISGISNGNGSKIISRIVKNTRGTGILVNNNSDIQEIADLKGKTIAVLLGGAGQKCLDLYLEDAGLTEDDVYLVNLSAHDEIVAAFEKNEIDAAISSSLAYLSDSDSELCHLLIDFTEHPNYAYLEVQQDFIDKHADILEKFVGALYQAQEWYYENVDEGNEIVAEFLGLDLADVEAGLASVDITMGIEEEDIENFTVTYQFLQDNDLLPDEITDLSTIYDDTYINKVLENNQ